MSLVNRTIGFVTHGSDRPLRRLLAYYAVLAAVVTVLLWLFPPLSHLLLGDTIGAAAGPTRLLQDGLSAPGASIPVFTSDSLPGIAVTTLVSLAGTLALMLPVSWVYMSSRESPGHNQSVAQTLIILPLVIAGVVFVVRDSLALALSLAGVVAAVRFRTTLRDARDSVFIFLAIAVGFAAGVQTLAVGAFVSMIFNFVLLLTWRYDFGRNVLAPTPVAQWSQPLDSLARDNGNGNGHVPDRDLMLALTPKKVEVLAERFDRMRQVLGPKVKKPRFNAVLTVTSDHVGEAQVMVQKVLDKMTKRWLLDEVVSHVGKPSQLHYLVRISKSLSREELITALRARGGDRIVSADLELGEAMQRKRQETS